MMGDDASPRRHNPLAFLTAGLVLGVVALACLAWHTYTIYRECQRIEQWASRVEELRGAIIHLDEVLTMSARMAAATGDSKWEERYRRFEPQLDAAIKEAVKLAPASQGREAAAKTDTANLRLVAMENRAFDLVRQGHAPEARALLSSDEYETQKRVYAQGMKGLAAGLSDAANAALAREKRQESLHAAGVVLLIPFLIVAWVVVFRATRNWQATATENARRLAQQAQALAKLNRSLDQKVAQRTQELARSNAALRDREQMVRAIGASAQDAVIMIDNEGKIVYWNAAAERIFGYARDEALGRGLHDFLAPERFREASRKGLAAFRSTGQGAAVGKLIELAALHKDGTELAVELSLSSVRIKGQWHALGFVRDITERKRVEEDNERILHDMGERVKELKCMYAVAQAAQECATLEELFQAVATLIPPGWHYPEITRGKVRFDGRGYVSEPFEETAWKLSSDIVVDGEPCGSVEVYYLEERPGLDEGPFLAEERSLINGLARALGAAIERRRAEDERRRVATIVEQAGEGIAVADLDGTLTFANAAWARMHGYDTGEELVGWNLSVFVGAGDTRAGMHPLGDQAGPAGYQNTLDLRHVRKDGERFAARMTVTAIKDEEGTLVGLMAFARDITERKRAEEELKRSERRYRTLVENLPQRIFYKDRESVYVTCNENYARDLHITADEIAGKTDFDLHPKELAEKYRNDDKRVMQSGEAEEIEEAYVLDGEERVVQTVKTPVRDEHGNVVGLLGIFWDITERKLLERELGQAQKLEAIGQLAAGIAHEINTPTQYVGDNTRFLQESFGEICQLLDTSQRLLASLEDGAVAPGVLAELQERAENADLGYLAEEIPRAIAESLEGIERVTEIVGAMKEFSHPGGDEKVAVDLNRAIESTITVARNEWKYVADVATDFDRALPLVSCVPGDLNQVILNVIVNAAHAIADVVGDGAAQKGTIAVSTRRDGEWAEVRVADTGIGIPEDVRPRIFDPFFTTKKVGQGTGQGLAIAHSVVAEKHGGTLTFETEKGTGTTFVIRLPIGPNAGS